MQEAPQVRQQAQYGEPPHAQQCSGVTSPEPPHVGHPQGS
jgi:hypothetical protein